MPKKTTQLALHIVGPTSVDWKMIEIPDQELETLQSRVGDDVAGKLNYIERVPVQALPAGVNVWVDEEGKLKGLPPVAEWLFQGRVHDVLVGRVLVTGPKKTGLTEEHVAKLKRFVRPLETAH